MKTLPSVPLILITRVVTVLPITLAIVLLPSGCHVSPIPPKIEQYYADAHALYEQVNPVLQEGDLIFRRGHFFLFDGMLNYSKVLAYWTASPFAHVGLVYQKIDDTFIIIDTSVHGIERAFLIDWLIKGPENLVVKRLRPEFRDKLPLLHAAAKDLLDRDVLHDDAFISNDDRYYCTEIVDHVFREAGLPLAPRLPIRELPRVRPWFALPFYEMLALIVGMDIGRDVAVAGNENYGMYGSPLLEDVINLLPPKYHKPPFSKVTSPAKSGKQ